jgi:hypothetical protein
MINIGQVGLPSVGTNAQSATYRSVLQAGDEGQIYVGGTVLAEPPR